MSTTDLYLLGAGIRGTLQLSRETIQALASCRRVYVLHDDLMVHGFVRDLGPEVVDLASLYDQFRVRADVYRRISEILVEDARQAPGVAFLVHGHPLFLVSATEYTLELARDAGVTVEMLAAVSSFDTLLCDLEVDYGYGLQMFDSSTLLEHGWRPNPHVPMLVFQLATTNQPDVVHGDPDPAVLQPLVDRLLAVYPPDHACVVVHSGAHLLERSHKRAVPLADLAHADSLELWKRPTLYVPPLA